MAASHLSGLSRSSAIEIGKGLIALLQRIVLGVTALAVVSCTPKDIPTSPAISSTTQHSEMRIAIAGETTPMKAILHLPPGDGQFRLAVLNHGSSQSLAQRAAMTRPDFTALRTWLVQRRFAVLTLQRLGHGETGGRYLEDQGGCTNPDYLASGLATARMIWTAIVAARGNPQISGRDTIVLGQSAGAFGGVALAAANPDGIVAFVHFSAVRGARNRGRIGETCNFERLLQSVAAFGRTTRVPSLWLYAENDSFVPPDLAKALADSHSAAGAPSSFVLTPPVLDEGHGLIYNQPAWEKPLDEFLKKIR